MVVLDETVVNVSLPALQRSLSLTQANLAWVVNAYLLTFAGFLVLGGKAADRLGRRRMFMIGMAVFASASLVCGLAGTPWMLVVGRTLQGLGGALLSPAALSILLTSVPERSARTRALGVWGAIAGVGGTTGIVLGGLLVESFGWRSVFFVNVMVGAAIIPLAARLIPKLPGPPTAPCFDVVGAFLVTAGALMLVLALLQGQAWGWTSAATIACLTLAAMLLAGFAVWGQRPSNPLLPLGRLTSRNVLAANAASLLLSAAVAGLFFFATLFMQEVLGYTPLVTGLAYTPLGVAIIVTSGIAPRLIERIGLRVVLVLGLAQCTAGFILLSRVSPTEGYLGPLFWGLMLLAVGMGPSFVALNLAATRDFADDDSGFASALLTSTQQIGAAVGLAVLSAAAALRTAGSVAVGNDARLALTHGFTETFSIGAFVTVASGALVIAFVHESGRSERITLCDTVAQGSDDGEFSPLSPSRGIGRSAVARAAPDHGPVELVGCDGVEPGVVVELAT